MAELIGQYTHNLDQQNRVAIPAKMREELGESFVLCKAPNGDPCLMAYAREDWRELMAQMNNQTPSRKLTRDQRMVHRNAELVELDKQGRVTIPQRFMEVAQLKNEVFILGAGRRMELWSPVIWQQMEEEYAALEEPDTVNFAF